ncbi:MAG: glycine--tRNA ligase subunit beta [Desulfobacteraceae bacterium]|nr:MAG: glycine--tRNA ligase subunit beta [Desulfobacteraceae bacterium]
MRSGEANKMGGELLLEIGTEEIPSDYLDNGLAEMKRIASNLLETNRIHVEDSLVALGTPRRLVLMGKGISPRQEDTVQEMMGPPKKAAYDQQGNPTKAALGFAQKQGVAVEELQIVETPRGEYLFVRRKIEGRETAELLSELLPRLISEIPWPKSMRWGGEGFLFVRPIHWILSLYGGQVIPMKIAGIQSGKVTRGHRFMAPAPVEVNGVEDYLGKMKANYVVLDPRERSSLIEKAVVRAAASSSGSPVLDPDLLSTVANMVEYPSAVCGAFDGGFLRIPDPVLITAMKKHQKYFAVRDAEGKLMPNFVAVNNTVARDVSVVTRGHERVLRARLSDADFFFKEDAKRSLLDRLKDLKGVVYQADLGTSFDKVQRFTALAEYLSAQIAPQKSGDVRLAASLCKCDLVTNMVMEFPTLQGVMGSEYASIDGHPAEVCRAIYEHYLPERAGGALPSSVVGAIVGVADRMDTICGFFAVQMEPTGAADPYALRRHALAVMRIIENHGWKISLRDLIGKSLSALGETVSLDRGTVERKVIDFFKERYRQMMLRSEYGPDLIEAVISTGFDRIDDLHLRIEQLARFVRESGEFQSLVLTSKRVSNILKNQERSIDVNPALFRESCESALWETYLGARDEIRGLVEKGEYFDALNLMAGLRKPVDEFFEGVEILTKSDASIKNNRVAMLHVLSGLLTSIADFSKFAV